MATRYNIHPDNPQLRSISAIVEDLKRGAIMLYPTDTVFAIGCDLHNKNAQERIRRLRRIPDDKPLTFVTSSMSEISDYGHISDTAYTLLRRLVPGPYTFLFPATKLVPKLVLNPKRKVTGIRIPDHIVCQLLIKELGRPVVSMSARMPDQEIPETRDELFDLFDPHVDIIVDDNSEYRFLASEVSTMIDLTGDEPVIAREGLGLELALQYM